MDETLDIILTSGQRLAAEKIDRFMKAPDAHIETISGPAGTGKTTLIGWIKDSFPGAIVCAPTNKAVSVLRQKGFTNATTLDRVLNKSVYVEIRREPTKEEELFYADNGMELPGFMLEESYEKIEKIGSETPLVIDEASMTSQSELFRCLEMFPKIIAVGDGFQLPPVDGVPWFQDWDHSIELTQIVRTADDSEIPQLCGLIRARNASWQTRKWQKDVSIIRLCDMTDITFTNANIMLAFKNKTCDFYNPIIRSMRGLEHPGDPTRPVKGDWLLSWQTINSEYITKSDVYEVMHCGIVQGGYACLLRSPLTGHASMVSVCKATLEQQQSKIRVARMAHFSYAHCITAHKSQGSEFDNVVVFASDKTRSHEDYWNWLYTACSRAKKQLTIIT